MFNRIFGCFIGFNLARGAGERGPGDKKTTHVGNEEDGLTHGANSSMKYGVNAEALPAHPSQLQTNCKYAHILAARVEKKESEGEKQHNGSVQIFLEGRRHFK